MLLKLALYALGKFVLVSLRPPLTLMTLVIQSRPYDACGRHALPCLQLQEFVRWRERRHPYGLWCEPDAHVDGLRHPGVRVHHREVEGGQVVGRTLCMP